MSLAVEIEHMMLELNYIVVPNNIEIGGGGLSQIFCGRLSENLGKLSTGFDYLLHNIFFASAYVILKYYVNSRTTLTCKQPRSQTGN